MSALDDIRAKYKGNDENLLQRSARRAGQEVLSAPGALPGLYGLAGAAWDHYVHGEEWGDSFLSEEGKATMDAAMKGDTLAQMRLKHKPTSVLRTGLHSAAEWYNWGGDVTGVTDNEDGSVPLDEEVGGIVLSTALTLPASILSKPAAAINKISNRAARLGTTAALRGVEMATPVTVGAGKYGSNIAANAVVQTAINDVTRELMDESSLYDHVTGQVADTDDGLPLADEGEVAGAALAAGGAAAIALGGGRAANRLIRSNTPRTPNGSGIEPPPSTDRPVTSEGDVELGEMPLRDSSQVRDLGADLEAVTHDRDKTLTEAVLRVGGVNKAAAFEDELRALSGNASRVAFDRYINTGILDETGEIRTAAPNAWLSEVQRLPKSTTDRLNQTLLNLDELTRRQQGVSNSRATTADIELQVDHALRDPKIKQLVMQHDDIMQGYSKLRRKHGIIDEDQFLRERARGFDPNTNRGGYVAAVPKNVEDTGIRKLGRLFTRATDDNLDVARFEKRAAKGGIDERELPTDIFGRYLKSQHTDVNNARVQRRFLQTVADAPVRDFKQGRKIVTRNAAEGTERQAVRVRENGKTQTYYVGDPRIQRALNFTPHFTVPIGRTMRRAYTETTTGRLNPLFAPVSLAYDAMFGMLGLRSQKLVGGRLDQALARNGLPPHLRQMLAGITRPIDTMMLIGEGFIEGGKGRFAQEMARHVAIKAQRDGTPMTEAAAAKWADTFMKTKYGLMHSRGYSGNVLTDDMIDVDQRLRGEIMARVDASGIPAMGRWFNSFFDNIRDAYRMGLYSRNIAHAQLTNGGRPLTDSQINRITRHVREVAVDPTRRGSSDFVNAVTSVTPYGNIMLQSTLHLARSLTNMGAWSVVGTMTAASAMFKSMMSDEQRDMYENRTPSYKKINHMPVVVGPGEEDVLFVPLGPEMGLLVNGVADTALEIINGTPTPTGEPTPMEDVWRAFGDLVSIPVPPFVNLLAGASGRGPVDVGGAMEGRALFRQPQEVAGLEEFRGIGANEGLINDRLYHMITSLTGTLGRTVMDAIEVMDQELAQPDPRINEGMDRALDVVKYGVYDKQKVGTLFNYLFDAGPEVAKPRGTPLSQKVYEIDDSLERVAKIARALVPNFSQGPRDADIPYDEAVTVLPELLQDPQLKLQAQLVKTYFGTPMHSKALRDVSQLRQSYFRTNSNTRVSLNTKNTVLNQINDEMHGRYDSIVQSYGEFEAMMQQRFGEGWTIDKFIDAAENDIRGN